MRAGARSDLAASPVIATLLMVAATVVLATVVYLVAVNVQKGAQNAPAAYAFDPDYGNGTIMLISAPPDTDWERLSVSGCDEVPEGAMRAGDRILGCAGDVLIIDTVSNQRVASYEFPDGEE